MRHNERPHRDVGGLLIRIVLSVFRPGAHCGPPALDLMGGIVGLAMGPLGLAESMRRVGFFARSPWLEVARGAGCLTWALTSFVTVIVIVYT